MRNERNRPVIEPEDYPATVAVALEWARMRPEHTEDEGVAWYRQKELEEARDSVRDGFAIAGDGELLRPSGEALLYMTFEGLETVLQRYRAGVVAFLEDNSEEVARIDELIQRVKDTKVQ